MRVAILHNDDHSVLAEDPAREAREDVVRVAAKMAETLGAVGLEVEVLAVDASLARLQAALAARRPDAVVNLCESLEADSRGELVVPTMLELLHIPYTGSSAMALGLALHKHQAKDVLRAHGIDTPLHQLVNTLEELSDVSLPFPLIVKPSREDASTGIEFDSVVSDRTALGHAVSRVLRTFHQPALVEQYVDGREIAVPLLGNAPRRALPLTEIHFGEAFEGKPRIVSYAAKWEPTSPYCIQSPSELATLEPELERRCVDVAMRAFEALECRDYGRVDLRLDASGRPWVIEVNPNCDLHPQAGFARAAAHAGIAYESLALHLLELAGERAHGHSPARSERPAFPLGAARPHRDLHTGRAGVRARAHRRRAPTGQS